MPKEFLTLDDVQVKGKKVLVRVDINCPVSEDQKVTNDERIKLHALTTIKELHDKGARTILLSHQGSPGDADFISLEGHAPLIEKYLGTPVRFVDDIFGSHARDAIAAMKDGDVILLENVRFFSEEVLERPADAQARVPLVAKLAPVVDLYVNDAFAAIHRSQPSLVGFGELVPTVAGRVIEQELTALNRVFQEGQRPIVYVLGGVKVKESLKVISTLLKSNHADLILTGGLLGNLFLVAKGYDLGRISWEVIKGKNIDALLPQAQELVAAYGDRIETPVDVAVNNAGRKEVSTSELPTPYMISDIGRETVGRYCKILEGAKTVVINSPMGRFEIKDFSYGTEAVLRKSVSCGAFSIVGGGHSAKMVSELGIGDKFNHVSIGGRATLYHLAGEKTPVVTMLKKAAQKWKA